MKKLSVIFFVSILCFGFVFSGTINVVTPNATSKWSKGLTQSITWTSSGCTDSNIKINIFKDSITPANFIQQLVCSDTGSKSWTIPNNFTSGNYILRIKTADNNCYGDSEVFVIKERFWLPGDIMKKKKKPLFKPPKGFMKPKIQMVIAVPLGALRPGSKLFLKGKNFGEKAGKIFVKGDFPGGKFELQNVKWESSEKVNGIVPQSVNGNPNQVVNVVLLTSYNFKSEPWRMKFEGREEKFLVLGDAKVLTCGSDGNFNACNKLSPDGSICTSESVICGYHKNSWGTVGDDVGIDSFQITLKNGWVFKSMQKIKWVKSSNDEVLNGPSPGLAVGASTWTTSIDWKVSSNDHVIYQIRILVEGPIGTNYK